MALTSTLALGGHQVELGEELDRFRIQCASLRHHSAASAMSSDLRQSFLHELCTFSESRRTPPVRSLEMQKHSLGQVV